MAYRAFKYRLYPTANQDRELCQQLETLRRVYNDALAWWTDAYEKEKGGERVIPRKPKKGGGERKLGIVETLYPVFASRRNDVIEKHKSGCEGPHWMARISAVSMRDTIKRVDLAFRGFFSRLEKGFPTDKLGFPRLKPRGRLVSIPFGNYPEGGCTLRDQEGRAVRGDTDGQFAGFRLNLFGVGRVKVRLHRHISGVIKTVSIKRDVDGKWYVYFMCVSPDVKVVQKVGPAVGIDMGLEHFLTTSQGEHVQNPRFLRRNLRGLRVLQRSAIRKMLIAKKTERQYRECKNLQKAFRTVSRLHVKIRNQREDHRHKVSQSLVKRYATICVESLNVQGMIRNRNFSRSIQDAGWVNFLITLKEHAAKHGVTVVEVDAWGTSQTCPRCDCPTKKKLSQRRHRCGNCGYETHRDHAAAQVILKRGTGANGLGCNPPCGNLGNGRDRKGITVTGSNARRRCKSPRVVNSPS